MLGYLCAYYRHYYPIEFCTAFLNCSKSDEDIYNGTMLAKRRGFNVVLPKFRMARSDWWFDKDAGIITKGIGSIKYMNEQIAEELYALRDNKYEHFTDLLYDLRDKTTINSRQLEILIKIDFFSEFGDIAKLEYLVAVFEKLADKKVIPLNKVDEIGVDAALLEKYSGKKTETRVDELDVERWALDNGISPEDLKGCEKPSGGLSTRRVMTKFGIEQTPELLEYATKVVTGRFSEIDNAGLLRHIERTTTIEPASIRTRVQYQQECLGYIDYKDPGLDPRNVIVTAVDTKYSPRITVYCLKSGQTCDMRIHKRRDPRNNEVVVAWSELPLAEGDFIYMKKCKKTPRQKKSGDSWVAVPGEYVWWLNDYRKVG